MPAQIRNPGFVWTIAGSNMLLLLVVAGTTFYSGSVFLVPLQQLMDASRSAVSLVFTIVIVTSGLCMPLAGMLIDKFGPRRMMLTGITGLAVVFFMYSQAAALWQLYVIALFQGIFQPISGGMSNQVLVGRWFNAKRGRAMGITGAGIGIGGLVFPWLLGSIIASYGIRSAYMTNTLCLLFFCIPILLFIIRDTPQSVGLLPDGKMSEDLPNHDMSQSVKSRQTRDDQVILLRDAAKTPAFWMLLISSGLGLSLVGVMSLHLPAILQDTGLSLPASSRYLGMMLGLGVLGRLVIGELTDRFKTHHLYSCSLLGMGLICFTMLFPHIPAARMAFIIGFGISQAAAVTLLPIMVHALFGVRSFGRVYGPIGLTISFAISGSNYLAGVVRDVSGNYAYAIICVAVLGIIASMVSLFIRQQESQQTPAFSSSTP